MPLGYSDRFACLRGGAPPWGLAVAGGCAAGREDVQVQTETQLRRAAAQFRKNEANKTKLRTYWAAREAREAQNLRDAAAAAELAAAEGAAASPGTAPDIPRLLLKPKPKRRHGVSDSHARTFLHHPGVVFPNTRVALRREAPPHGILHPEGLPQHPRRRFLMGSDAGGIPFLGTSVDCGEVEVRNVSRGKHNHLKVVIRHGPATARRGGEGAEGGGGGAEAAWGSGGSRVRAASATVRRSAALRSDTGGSDCGSVVTTLTAGTGGCWDLEEGGGGCGGGGGGGGSDRGGCLQTTSARLLALKEFGRRRSQMPAPTA